MDKSDRARYKQLANDSIIAAYGRDDNEARLAQALEVCIEDLEYIATECDQCKYCDVHGEIEDDEIQVNANEIIRIHKELKESLKAMKEYHVKLTGEIADEFPDLLLADDLAELIEEVEGHVDELEAEVLP